MIRLLQNAEVYSPEYLGNRDIWIMGDKILCICEPGEFPAGHPFVEIISCDGLSALPGIVDTHVHITGGGGESGAVSRVAEISVEEITHAGVSTVCGLLGADRQTRSLKNLLAKAKALESQGVSTYIYAGSYEIPPVTFTGDIGQDMLLVDKMVGVGEVAVSDYRSSHAGVAQLIEIAAQTYLGGMISGKAGIVVLHMGDGKNGLTPIRRMLRNSDLPESVLLPTHVNRNEQLFRQAISYAKAGGYIDLTSGEIEGIAVPDALRRLLRKNVPTERISISSDGGGSRPGGGVCKVNSLYQDVVEAIKSGIAPQTVFSFVTSNAARRVGLYPRKGSITPGADADILLVDGEYNIQKLICIGKTVADFAGG